MALKINFGALNCGDSRPLYLAPTKTKIMRYESSLLKAVCANPTFPGKICSPITFLVTAVCFVRGPCFESDIFGCLFG